MADEVDDLISKFKLFVSEYSELRVSATVDAAIGIGALRRNRIINKGEGADGEKLGVYTAKTQQIKVDRSKGKLPGGKRSLSVIFPTINLQDTGQMWNSQKPKVLTVNEEVVEVAVEPEGKRTIKETNTDGTKTVKDNAALWEIHKARFKEKLGFSDEELQLAEEIISDAITKKLAI